MIVSVGKTYPHRTEQDVTAHVSAVSSLLGQMIVGYGIFRAGEYVDATTASLDQFMESHRVWELEPVRVGHPVRVREVDPAGDSDNWTDATGIVLGRVDPDPNELGATVDGHWLIGLATAPCAQIPEQGVMTFAGSELEVTGDVSQSPHDPYPCGNCGGRGRTKLAPLSKCSRCAGVGADPYAQRGVDPRSIHTASHDPDTCPECAGEGEA